MISTTAGFWGGISAYNSINYILNQILTYEEKLLYVGLPHAFYGSTGNSSGKQYCRFVR